MWLKHDSWRYYSEGKCNYHFQSCLQISWITDDYFHFSLGFNFEDELQTKLWNMIHMESTGVSHETRGLNLEKQEERSLFDFLFFPSFVFGKRFFSYSQEIHNDELQISLIVLMIMTVIGNKYWNRNRDIKKYF